MHNERNVDLVFLLLNRKKHLILEPSRVNNMYRSYHIKINVFCFYI